MVTVRNFEVVFSKSNVDIICTCAFQ